MPDTGDCGSALRLGRSCAVGLRRASLGAGGCSGTCPRAASADHETAASVCPPVTCSTSVPVAPREVPIDVHDLAERSRRLPALHVYPLLSRTLPSPQKNFGWFPVDDRAWHVREAPHQAGQAPKLGSGRPRRRRDGRAAEATLLCRDHDFECIASVTGQALQWYGPEQGKQISNGCSSGRIHRRTAPFKSPIHPGSTAGQDVPVRPRTPRRRLGKRVGDNPHEFESRVLRVLCARADDGPDVLASGPSWCVPGGRTGRDRGAAEVDH